MNRRSLFPASLRAGLGRPGLLLLLVLAGFLLVKPVWADFAPANWQYLKPIVLPPDAAAGQLVELTLDREVFAGSAQGQVDLRILQDEVREVPYQLEVADGSSRRESAPAKVRDRSYLEGAHSSFVADLGPEPALHNEVEIDIDRADASNRNFRRQTLVETSFDGETWAVAREGAEIYDFTADEGEFNARDTGISYPETAARYLRVRVINGPNRPLDIEGASVFRSVAAPAASTAYTPRVLLAADDGERGIARTVVDLGRQGIPTSRLSFQSRAANFHRQVVIAGSNDGEAWQERASAEVYSFDLPEFVGSRLALEYPESSYRYYQLSVHNGDNLPLPMERITLHSVDRRLRFMAEPGGEYRLYYGNPLARQPDYDLAAMVQYMDTGDLPEATLGAGRPNEAFSGFDVPLTERYPWLLPSGIVAAAVAIAGLLFGVFRKAKSLLPPPGAEPGA